jgi:hypothetical protein
MIRPHEAEGSEPAARIAGIAESIAVFLRKEETSAMILDDEKLDCRKRRDRDQDRRIGCSRPHLQPERVAKGGRKIFI